MDVCASTWARSGGGRKTPADEMHNMSELTKDVANLTHFLVDDTNINPTSNDCKQLTSNYALKTEKSSWSEREQTEEAASLLLQDIDFLALSALQPVTQHSVQGGSCLAPNALPVDNSNDCTTMAISNLTTTIKQEEPVSPSPVTYLWKDCLPLPDDAALCDELPEDFDLLAYADSPDERFLQENDTLREFWKGEILEERGKGCEQDVWKNRCVLIEERKRDTDSKWFVKDDSLEDRAHKAWEGDHNEMNGAEMTQGKKEEIQTPRSHRMTDVEVNMVQVYGNNLVPKSFKSELVAENARDNGMSDFWKSDSFDDWAKVMSQTSGTGDPFEEGSMPAFDLRSRSPVEDLETETCFTRIKPRPRCLSAGSILNRPVSPGDRPPPLSKQSRRDAGEPKRPKNGFIRFSIKHRAELLKLYPYKDNRTISKMLGMRWKKMTRAEKQPYVDEFNQDIHKIRVQNPKWRYAPAKRSAEELIDPMIQRLRPRDKIRAKMLWSRNTDWEWGMSADDSNHSGGSSGSDGRYSPLQHSATTWKQCDFCSQWRPLPGHVNSQDLPQTWCCYMNPDCRFNRCWTHTAADTGNDSMKFPQQSPSYSCDQSPQVPLMFLLPTVCSHASTNLAHDMLVSHATTV